MGGSGPLTYRWFDYNINPLVPAQTTATATGLIAGTYYVQIRDSNNCTILSDSIVVTAPCSVTLDLNIFIEGYWLGGGQMNPRLYNNYINFTITDPYGLNDCDSIFVELRDSMSTSVTVERSFAILHTDGTASVTFPGTVSGNRYYIAVFHDNALETWSAETVLFGSTNSYDFTTDVLSAFGANMVSLDATTWGFYSGDLDHDGNIGQGDFPFWDNDNSVGNVGYFPGDMDGDVNIGQSDFPFWDNNNTTGIYTIHP